MCIVNLTNLIANIVLKMSKTSIWYLILTNCTHFDDFQNISAKHCPFIIIRLKKAFRGICIGVG